MLVDARHGLKDADDAILDTLSKAAVSHEIVLTKSDQVEEAANSPNGLRRVKAAMRKRPAAFPDLIATSSHSGAGIENLRAAIARLLAERSARDQDQCWKTKIMNNGLEGVVAAETVLSHADGESGAVWVRGHTIESLAAEQGYEGAVAVMWEGFAGRGLTRAGMREALAAARAAAFARSGEWLDCAAPAAAGRRFAHRACRVAGRRRARGHSRDACRWRSQCLCALMPASRRSRPIRRSPQPPICCR